MQVVGGIRAGKLARPAYEILQRQHIDMVPLYLSMPLVSRHDVLQEWHTADTSVKIIAGNWYATASDQIADVADLVPKPIGLTAPVRKVHRALDNQP